MSQQSSQRFLKLALIGHPVSHSLSPVMHRAAMSHCGLSGTYELIDLPPEQLSAGLQRLRQGYTGFNITIPHKQAVMRYLDELTQEARCIQAVNTVRVEGRGRLVGHNTDASGFLLALKKLAGTDTIHFPSACLVGAGGAARAALWALAEAGCAQLVIVARTQREARLMKEEFHRLSDKPMQIIMRSPGEPLNTNAPALIVNCTPIGLSGDPVPEWFISIMNNSRRGAHIPVFFDMVYGRSGQSTPLVQAARKLGLIASDGLPMLVEQAVMSFEFWTGVRVPAPVLADAIAQKQATAQDK